VLYELHVGTFTPEGTWAAASEQLPDLAELGITAIELMPVHEFPGRFGWSYDGVDLFAPFHGYGTPDDFRRFVDRAHGLGLSVLLDVMYNHLGPVGNVLKAFSDDYFSKRHVTEWGEALNFDGENAGPVREFVRANAGYWVDEFHADGVRVDATQSLFDTAEGHEHILAELARAIRGASRCRGCRALVVGESEPQRARLLRPEFGFDMLWSDDFHHTAMVAATGCREGYYGDYHGTPQELVSVLKRGWLYQGQWNLRQSKRRGSPALDLPPAAFIFYLQNHDQVANSAKGLRLQALTTPGRFRALTALQLLAPATPLLFQGQEFAASSPFLYFGDHAPATAARMREGRRAFVRQFPSLATGPMQARVPDPADPEVFARSKLDPFERDRDRGPHAEALALHRDLLRLRRDDPVFRLQRPGALDGAVLGPEALVLRWFGPAGDDRLLLVNLGAELRLEVAPEPLLAPPDGTRWRVLWSSEDPAYGGSGTPAPETESFNWRLNGHSALALAPEPFDGDEHRNAEGTV
jgi:maltooligosyltrehalose trehalohydrolase